MTDINAAFDASKLDQINAAADKAAALRAKVEGGELRDNGNGTYTVLTGWDRGETIRMSSEGQILAEHGLDMLPDGRAKLYSTQKEWFGLGQIVPDGLDDINEVLELIGGPLEFSKQPAFYKDPMTGEFQPIPDTFAAVWTDQDMKNAAMGAVGNRYTHAQDTMAAEFLLNLTGQVNGGGEVVFESVGRMLNNAKFFAGLRLRDDMIIDPEGIADGIRQYLYLINSHDGTGKLNFMVTPWRIRCRNTERFAVRDAKASWGVRHTANWGSDARKAEARIALGLTSKYYQNWRDEQMELLGHNLTGVSIDKFWAVVDDLATDGSWGKPEAEKGRGVTIYNNRRDSLEELLGKNVRELGRNAYAAERAVTEYLDHQLTRRTSASWGDASKDDARRGIALLGNDDDKKARLHEGLLTLARG
jgi:phage/plasmid-like protein (TIGR03299 family)